MARFVLSFLLVSMLVIALISAKTSVKSRNIRSGEKYIKSVKDVPKPKSFAKADKSCTKFTQIKSQPKCVEKSQNQQENVCLQQVKARKDKEQDCAADKEIESSEVFCSKCCSLCQCNSEFPVININTYPSPNYVDEKVVNEEEELLENDETEENETEEEYQDETQFKLSCPNMKSC